MRVIAGLAKGKKLRFPRLSKDKRLRPLTGRVKEALFNILVRENQDARFLDLFAGTGSVGIEALSRGAGLAIFVEFDRKIVQTLRENLALAGFSDRAEVYCLDVMKAVKVIDKSQGKFDIVFIGAPYAVPAGRQGSPVLEEALKTIAGTNIVDDNGVVVAEHSVRDKILDSYGKLAKYRDAKYGDT
ncbi:MAG: 16S rRNA (guanine(966)-N(2))-methyltransferase RsmD, partial [bacterium]